MVGRDHEERLVQNAGLAVRVLDHTEIVVEGYHDRANLGSIGHRAVYMAERPIKFRIVYQCDALMHGGDGRQRELGRQSIVLAVRGMDRRQDEPGRIQHARGWCMPRNGDRNVSPPGIALKIHDGIGGWASERRRGVVLVTGQGHDFRAWILRFVEPSDGGCVDALHDFIEGAGVHHLRREQTKVVVVLRPVKAEDTVMDRGGPSRDGGMASRRLGLENAEHSIAKLRALGAQGVDMGQVCDPKIVWPAAV